MPRRDRRVTVDELPDLPAAGPTESAKTAAAFSGFGAAAKELVSPPTPGAFSLVASFNDTRLSLARRCAALSHTLALPIGEVVTTLGATYPWASAPTAATLGLELVRPPSQGAGLLSCTMELDAAQRTGSVSAAAACLSGRLKVGAAAALGGGRPLQSYSLGCEFGSTASGLVGARCDGAMGTAPSALTLSLLGPPVTLGAAAGPLTVAAEVTTDAEGGRNGRVGATVPLGKDGLRAKVTADARGGCSCHLMLHEGGIGAWQPGARGLPPSFAVGATISKGAAGTGADGCALGVLPLRLFGERAVSLPLALSSTPLLLTVEPGGAL